MKETLEKIAKDYKMLTKLAKFRQIWPHCSRVRSLEDVCLFTGWLADWTPSDQFRSKFWSKIVSWRSWRGMQFSAETVETREESTLLVLGKTSLDSARGKEIIIQTKIWWRNNSWLLIFNFYSHASLGKTKDSPKDPPRFNVVQYN